MQAFTIVLGFSPKMPILHTQTNTKKLLSLSIVLFLGALIAWQFSYTPTNISSTTKLLDISLADINFFSEPKTELNQDLDFIRTDKKGKPQENGNVFVIIFDPQAPNLDFKVNLPLTNPIYAQESGKIVENYSAQTFEEILANPNALLKDQKPLAAINADYVDENSNPQGFNVSRGVNYSGIFANYRSSFAISGNPAPQRTASIQIGKRTDDTLNFNAVGGNGRFYTQGNFEDICLNLGTYACSQSTNRSMVAITSAGKVIFLVYSENGTEQLLPSEFDDLLENIAKQTDIGTIRDAMLFDGGRSPGIMYNDQIYAQHGGPIGSVFLIYKI